MPCNCDHMEPTAKEIKYSKIACLIDELTKGKKNIDQTHWRGMHPSVYSQTYDKYQTVNEDMEQELVVRLMEIPQGKLHKYSLELQIWWRDYKKDKKNKMSVDALKKQKMKLTANRILSPLSNEEIEALKFHFRR